MIKTIDLALVAALVATPFTTFAETTTSTRTAQPAPSTTTAAPAEVQKEQPVAAPKTEERVEERVETRLLSNVEKPVPHKYTFWESASKDAFIKPVLQLSSTFVVYVPTPSKETSYASERVSTLLLARFGLEGQITEGISFRSVFERNVGFSLGRNGPVGTSVWEGTAALQARENFVRVQKWGFTVAGGIISDPASVDYTSSNVYDLFGMDPYTRDALLADGANQSQGFLLAYSRWGATVGFVYTGGNPLVSSLSLGFGGPVSAIGTLYTAPLRAITGGIPSTDIQLNVFGPSLSYERSYDMGGLALDVGLKLAAQFYRVDVDLLSETDANLGGYNLRSTAMFGIGKMVRVFGSFAYRENDQYGSVTDLSKIIDKKYQGTVAGGGADFDWGDLSVGGQFYWVRGRTPTDTSVVSGRMKYINLGATYWLYERTVSAGLRYARSLEYTSAANVTTKNTDDLILSLRLML